MKSEAAQVAEFYGLDLASVTRALWAQMVRTRSIPLDFRTPEPNEESLRAIEDAEAIIASGGGRRFGSLGELVEALES